MQVLDGIPDDWKILLEGNGDHTGNVSKSSISFHKVWVDSRLSNVSKLTINFIQRISTQPTAQEKL